MRHLSPEAGRKTGAGAAGNDGKADSAEHHLPALPRRNAGAQGPILGKERPLGEAAMTDREAKFEAMLQAIQQEYHTTLEKMEKLKAVVAYRLSKLEKMD